MEQSESFRCYYEDGSVFVSPDCPQYNNGSPLIDSEYQIIQDVYAPNMLPWFLIIMALVYSFTDQKGKPK